MPELPEVEQGARLLRDAAVGRRITAVDVLHPAYARVLPPLDQEALIGRTLTDVVRKGKHQLAVLDDGSTLEIHFRMTGEWLIERSVDAKPRFARLVVHLNDGTQVVLSDPRALGTARLHRPGALALPRLGPEPLSADFTVPRLQAALAGRRAPIKPVLLDQRVVAGLGNIYAAEALWLARIDPRAQAASLSAQRAAALVRAIRAVLRRAPALAYTDQPARASAWRVYDREGEPCRRCGSHVRRIVQGGRSTYYCPRCQTGRPEARRRAGTGNRKS